MTKTKRTVIAVLALILVLGTVGVMQDGSLSMLRGMIRCALLLGVAVWGILHEDIKKEKDNEF